jgi:hypothetical protein
VFAIEKRKQLHRGDVFVRCVCNEMCLTT